MPQVLVVDDDQEIRDLLRMVLEGEGYDVATARDGAEAIALLEQSEDTWILLLDILMPRMNGLMVCERLLQMDRARERYRVVLMTASELNRQDCPAPARTLLRKPFDLDVLLQEVELLAAEMDDALHHTAC